MSVPAGDKTNGVPLSPREKPVITPEHTPDDYAYSEFPPPLIRASSSTGSAGSTTSKTNGMGIHFPTEANPLPAALSSPIMLPTEPPIALPSTPTLRNEDFDRVSASMIHSRSTGAINKSNQAATDAQASSSVYSHSLVANLHSSPFRSQSPHSPSTIAPRPGMHPTLSNDSAAFASAIGYASEQRERAVSPKPSRFKDDHPPLDPGDSPNSPAADGKKEPSLFPSDPHLSHGASGPGPYDKEVPWNIPTSSHHPTNPSFFPLSGQTSNSNVSYKEAGLLAPASTAKPSFWDSTPWWLAMYFFFNLGLTLFNKVVLVSFPFPYTLTGLHALSGCAGTYFALEQGAFVPARLTQRENLILGAFSILYTINIAVSNISLQLVSVPFHQVVRASTPLFTIVISAIFLRTRFSGMKLISLLPVIAGVGLATYGDYNFTAWGLFLTLLGTFFAALKTVTTNLIQTGGGGRLKLHPLDLLMRMSPLAFIQCVAYGWYTGELERVRRYGATQMTRGKAIALLINGVIACGLNIVSFTANKKAGALTMTVSANCKQVMTIALAVILFDLHISPTNGMGIFLTLVGGGWYAYVEYTEKARKKFVKLMDRS
ncbi:hypothetical protein P7C73_g640, partial [Tremellales sp. Uapishka_1]